ncbi:MAG: hypothetical protein TYPL_1120 [Candidatus Tyloplasma litorale]|nr:MAG: hypothetical protein TYPL_1120 [Mycoplasmatales bacterium]
MINKDEIETIISKYRKTGLLRRVFAWNDILNNIESSILNELIINEKEFNLINPERETELKIEIGFLKKRNDEFQLNDNNLKREIEKLNTNLNLLNIEKKEIETKYNLLIEKNNDEKNINNSLKREIEIIKEEISNKNLEIQKITNEKIQIETELDLKTKSSEGKEKENQELKNTIEELRKNHDIEKQKIQEDFQRSKDELEQKKNELSLMTKDKNDLKKDIESKTNMILEHTNELNKVFRSSGKQGKFSEIHLENILQNYFGNPGVQWVKNLPVGEGRVEFGLNLEPGTNFDSIKWLPVDSKSLIPNEIDDDGKFIIDKKYISKVKEQGKKIANKYLDKENTLSWGIMVLPSENIFNTLFNENQEILKKMEKINIHITSPNNLISFVSTLYSLNQKFDSIKNMENIRILFETATKHMIDFYNNVSEGVDKLNTGFNKHMPNFKKKTEEAIKHLGVNKKVKEIKK